MKPIQPHNRQYFSSKKYPPSFRSRAYTIYTIHTIHTIYSIYAIYAICYICYIYYICYMLYAICYICYMLYAIICYMLYMFFFFFFNLTYSRWTSSLPSCLWSLRIFPSLPGSRLTIFYRDASSALSQLVNQWLNFTYSRSHAFRYERTQILLW